MLQPRPCLPVTYLQANATRRGERPAVIDGDRVLSFAELEARVLAVAAVLRSHGLREGEPVAVQLPNAWEHVALELAIPHAGGVVLPLPLSLGPAELEMALARSSAGLLVLSRLPESELARQAAEAAPGVRRVLEVEELFAADARGLPAPPGQEPDPERVVEIALTSGTTGPPKLASLTAGVKQATFEAFTGRLGVTARDRVLPLAPLMQGIGGMCLYCGRLGAALVMLREPRFSAEHALRVAAGSLSTLLVGVPTHVARMLRRPELARASLRALRTTAVAGAPMPPELAREWEERSGSRVCIFYGSMDAGQLAVASPDDPPEKRWFTVGKPHESCEAAIQDAAGRLLPAGREGEVCMRGATVQPRYWGEPGGPLAPDGWAHMGDLGFLDGDGYLHVVGRLSDIIIRGGTNINPHEVEEALRSHPDVEDACVVGRPDPELGERPHALLVASAPLDVEAVRAHLAARGLARYKWPESVTLVDEIPLSGPGKPDRKAAREVALAQGG